MPIHVSLDSSAIHSFGAAFSRLQSLVSEKIVKVYISEIVQKEISSQLKTEFSEKVNNSETSLRKILRHEWLQYIGDKTTIENAHKVISEAKEKLDEITSKGIDEKLRSLQAEILTVQPHHANLVIDSYFAGNHPFKHIKNREDFPDAFIFESAKDLKAQLAETSLHFVVADNTLRKALSQVGGILVHKDLNEFIQCDEVEILARQSESEKLWNQVYESILPNLSNLGEIFQNEVQARSIELLMHKEVTHPSIPEDNEEARISGLDAPEIVSFDWEDVKNYGAGLITIPFEFEVISEIYFKVFRGDAFTVTDGVWLEYKDPETNYYFDASGTVNIAVLGNISVQFENKQVEPEKIKDLFQEIQFIEIKEIEILEDDQGNIFIVD